MFLFLSSDSVWAFLTLTVTLIGIWEWSNLIKLNTWQMIVNMISSLGFGLALIFSSANYYEDLVMFLLSMSLVFWILIAPIWLISRKVINSKLGMVILGTILLMATWVALIGLHKISPWLLLSILASVWIADSAAYFSGKRFGRNKLAPEISPGKTWEGVLGAVLAVSLYGYILCIVWHFTFWLIVGLWLIVLLSVMGDLFESLLKRQSGVKDSSHLLPGHGGVLDRIDGLISTLALTLLYIYFPFLSSLHLHA